eukprot:7033412-Alexandrium_andersonii.AAC.1
MQVDAEADDTLPPPAPPDGGAVPTAFRTPAAPPARSATAAVGDEPALAAGGSEGTPPSGAGRPGAQANDRPDPSATPPPVARARRGRRPPT